MGRAPSASSSTLPPSLPPCARPALALPPPDSCRPTRLTLCTPRAYHLPPAQGTSPRLTSSSSALPPSSALPSSSALSSFRPPRARRTLDGPRAPCCMQAAPRDTCGSHAHANTHTHTRTTTHGLTLPCLGVARWRIPPVPMYLSVCRDVSPLNKCAAHRTAMRPTRAGAYRRPVCEPCSRVLLFITLHIRLM